MPESPGRLISKGWDAKMLHMFAYYYTDYNEKDPRSQHQSRLNVALRDAGNGKHMCIAIVLRLFPHWSGNGLFYCYPNEVLDQIGGTSPTMQLLISDPDPLLGAPRQARAALPLPYTHGGIICIQQYQAHQKDAAAHGTIAFICLVHAAYDLVFTPLIVGYSVEVLPCHLRAKGFNFAISFSFALIFNQRMNPIVPGTLKWKLYTQSGSREKLCPSASISSGRRASPSRRPPRSSTAKAHRAARAGRTSHRGKSAKTYEMKELDEKGSDSYLPPVLSHVQVVLTLDSDMPYRSVVEISLCTLSVSHSVAVPLRQLRLDLEPVPLNSTRIANAVIGVAGCLFVYEYACACFETYGQGHQSAISSKLSALITEGQRGENVNDHRPAHSIPPTQSLITTSLPNRLVSICTSMSQSNSLALAVSATPVAVDDSATPAGALIPNYGNRIVQNGPGMQLNLAFSAGGVYVEAGLRKVAKVLKLGPVPVVKAIETVFADDAQRIAILDELFLLRAPPADGNSVAQPLTALKASKTIVKLKEMCGKVSKFTSSWYPCNARDRQSKELKVNGLRIG
ncbi:hypothetical protein FIBSPDRAFT_903345 [Athelia psychrophila]|uniref:Uncharacterized protein n=1 Tax=Athelia psychrophila TaxID=1759441 RepID=A0A167W4L9_9AGAM|nr:hypothetical protein FIBSPDRAFT_903345 [Fibularhizoctonia sp. CBS 109695]